MPRDRLRRLDLAQERFAAVPHRRRGRPESRPAAGSRAVPTEHLRAFWFECIDNRNSPDACRRSRLPRDRRRRTSTGDRAGSTAQRRPAAGLSWLARTKNSRNDRVEGRTDAGLAPDRDTSPQQLGQLPRERQPRPVPLIRFCKGLSIWPNSSKIRAQILGRDPDAGSL